MPDTASLSKTVAVLASPSRIDDMVTWVTSSVASLGGSSLLAAPKELADRLLQAQQLALDSRILSLRIVALDLPDPDVVIAGKVLAGEVQGVILFKDFQTSTQATPDLNLLTRVCDTSQTPMALNKATADLALRGVSNTRVAYLIYNPVAGQGDSVADLSLIRSILEPSIILHVVMTEKDRDVTDQAREIVTLIQAEDDNTSSSMQSMIVASGGDGTVAAIAGATMSTGIPFAAIPRGTAVSCRESKAYPFLFFVLLSQPFFFIDSSLPSCRTPSRWHLVYRRTSEQPLTPSSTDTSASLMVRCAMILLSSILQVLDLRLDW